MLRNVSIIIILPSHLFHFYINLLLKAQVWLHWLCIHPFLKFVLIYTITWILHWNHIYSQKWSEIIKKLMREHNVFCICMEEKKNLRRALNSRNVQCWYEVADVLMIIFGEELLLPLSRMNLMLHLIMHKVLITINL